MLNGGDDISNDVITPGTCFLFTFDPVLPFPAPPPERSGELTGRLGVMTYFSRGFASMF